MSSNVTLPREYQTWFILHEVDTGIQKVMEGELKPFKISVIAAGLMYILKTSDEPVTLGELSRWLFRKPHSISELVGRMEKQGLVKKVTSPENRKTVCIRITEKGDEIITRYVENMQVIGRIMSSLDEEETRNFIEYLDKIRKSVIEELVMGVQKPFPWGLLTTE